MKKAFDQVCRDYLALRGESPDLLPLLEEGVESAVLTLKRELEVRLLPAAIEATMALPVEAIDGLTRVIVRAAEKEDHPGLPYVRFGLPPDFLRLYSLTVPDLKEPLRIFEPEDSLRRQLGARAPAWMICTENPMMVADRDSTGLSVKVFGSTAISAVLLYAACPEFDGETLTISEAAYFNLFKYLKQT